MSFASGHNRPEPDMRGNNLPAWWVTFDCPVKIDGEALTALCVEARDEEHVRDRLLIEQDVSKERVKTVRSLPYPGQPRMEPLQSHCPSFCWTPKKCVGNTSCPKRKACDD